MTYYEAANDLNRSKIERNVAKLMNDGFAWDYIEDKLGNGAIEYCQKLCREIAGGSSIMSW